MIYDYLIVGAGLFGAVFAREAFNAGKCCLIIDRRSHIGGNCFTYEQEGVNIHKYGAHIFRTNDRLVWDYISQFTEFNHFVNSPIANFKGKLYNLPFNMNTFHQMWGVITPTEAMAKIESQRQTMVGKIPQNLEEQAISLVGTDIYEKLIKGYTQKQWGRKCSSLPAHIIRRLPVRFTYDNNYFNAPYQGIPKGGYTRIFDKMLAGIEVVLNSDYLDDIDGYNKFAKKTIYTGGVDALLSYKLGELAYRGLRFEDEILDEKNHQGVAVVNYTDAETPYTRIIEHKHFEFGTQDKTVITREYPATWKHGDEPYYPVNDNVNDALYEKYKAAANERYPNVILGGRLGEYRYYDMQDTVKSALTLAKKELRR